MNLRQPQRISVAKQTKNEKKNSPTLHFLLAVNKHNQTATLLFL